jgi:hypothetical protein
MSATIIKIGICSPRTDIFEIIEVAETRDQPFSDQTGWGSRPKRPQGDGWRISDFTHEKRTTWERRRLFPARRRP